MCSEENILYGLLFKLRNSSVGISVKIGYIHIVSSSLGISLKNDFFISIYSSFVYCNVLWHGYRFVMALIENGILCKYPFSIVLSLTSIIK